jgi:hypothetical protein
MEAVFVRATCPSRRDTSRLQIWLATSRRNPLDKASGWQLFYLQPGCTLRGAAR